MFASVIRRERETVDGDSDQAVMVSRRSALKMLLAIGAVLTCKNTPAARTSRSQLMRAIPSTLEQVPAVGLGTARSFDVGTTPAERAPLRDVLRKFVEMGGSVIDSSPMYGAAETVIGDLATELGVQRSLFVATKVWTSGRAEGKRQMQTSMERLRTERIDLMQVHNLLDWRVHLETLREWKNAGKIRYLGMTHYRVDAFSRLERLIKTEKLDYVQFNYSIATRDAEHGLLPLAADKGTAVLINRPFTAGALFRRVRGKPLPPWAADFDCESWAQFFLKYILAHPAVTCVIPATSKPKHLVDNMRTGLGRLPDERMRRRMVSYMERL